ncbi:MAG TPA: MFS transporter [Streptosporangiaceae bacterium]|nr:MFS transporter [Streptosporangiaceae bacterium]
MRKPFWMYLACCIAVFMIAMDNLIVTNALPVIRQALHTGLEGLEWTVNAYTMTFAVLLLTGAALGDRFGRRRLMLIGPHGVHRGCRGRCDRDSARNAGRAP